MTSDPAQPAGGRVATIAVGQASFPAYDWRANAQIGVWLIGEASAAGADLVVLPELASSGYALDRRRLGDVAEAADSDKGVLADWRAAAARHRTRVIAGFCEWRHGRLFNSAAVIDRAGSLVGIYRKLHLFAGEREVFHPGDTGLPVWEVGGVRIGVLVCYDLRFPEAMRVLAVQGAEIVAVPTAWVRGFDADQLDGQPMQVTGAVVQANLNQTFVACADQVGVVEDHEFLGRSLIVDPWGRTLAGPMPAAEPCLATVTLTIGEVARSRQRGPGISPMDNRRTDVYASLLGYEGKESKVET